MSRPKKYSAKRGNRKQFGKSKRRRVRSLAKKGGGCGCGVSTHGFFSGGSALPSTNAQSSIGVDKMIPLNTYNQDPNYMTVSSRGTGNFVQGTATIRGGKGKTHAKYSRRNLKKIKGGNMSTGGVIRGIQEVLPYTLTGASDFSAGSNHLISPVQYPGVTFENPLPKT